MAEEKNSVHQTMLPFVLFEPETLSEAIRILSLHGNNANVLAGGLYLLSNMRRWQIKPEYVVSIRRIPGLDYIKYDKRNGIRIGALSSIRSLELSSSIRECCAPLYESVQRFASVQVKTMGTVGGNLCVATPASDLATALFVLNARLKISGLKSEKIVPIERFCVGVGQTILKPEEIVVEILIPSAPPDTFGAFFKLENTKAAIAKVNVAVMATITDGTCTDARIALGSVAPTVIRAREAESIIKGKRFDEKLLFEVGEAVREEARPITDLRSTAEYRRDMVAVLVRRALAQVSAKALNREIK